MARRTTTLSRRLARRLEGRGASSSQKATPPTSGVAGAACAPRSARQAAALSPKEHCNLRRGSVPPTLRPSLGGRRMVWGTSACALRVRRLPHTPPAPAPSSTIAPDAVRHGAPRCARTSPLAHAAPFACPHAQLLTHPPPPLPVAHLDRRELECPASQGQHACRVQLARGVSWGDEASAATGMGVVHVCPTYDEHHWPG